MITEENRNISTLEELRLVKAEKKALVEKKSEQIAEKTRKLFAPTPSTDKLTSLLGLANKSIAMFDGFMLGMKVVKRIKKALKN